jgi:hypothetical protein
MKNKKLWISLSIAGVLLLVAAVVVWFSCSGSSGWEWEDDDDDSSDSYFNTMIVTNERFVIVSHDLPYANGYYPFTAYGRNPLYRSYPWLELFEF